MNITVDKLLDGLNDDQQQAVQVLDGKHLVLAGAGSGKTLVLTKRIQYLLSIGVKPWHIVGVSFTRKASREIQDRLLDMVGEDALDLNLGTFHSLCMRILIRNQHLLGMDKLTVLDDTQAFNIIKDIALTFGYSGKKIVAELQKTIDHWGNEGMTPAQVAQTQDYPEDLVMIYDEYQKQKRLIGYVDFNDILLLTIEILEKHPQVLQKYSHQYQYIMLDEAQDTNNPQFRILQLLSQVHGNYVLYADDLQAIYGFRGSNVNNIINLRDNDSEVEAILLEQNYRSTQTIVEASNAMVSHNTQQLEKVSRSMSAEGAPIFLYPSDNETREAEYIATVINGFVNQGTYDYDDFMILYRSHALSRPVEFLFNQQGIPYEVVGGKEFYERAEIKSLIAYFRAIDNPRDDLAFERVVAEQKGVGGKTLDRIKMYANEADIYLYQALEHIEDVPKVNKPTQERIRRFVQFIQKGQDLLERDDAVSIRELFFFILDETQFLDAYNTDKTEDLNRLDNIKELYSIINHFDNRDREALEEGQTIISQFLTETSLYVEASDEETRRQVTMMSVHGAKGMENKVVFIIGLNQGIFPSAMAETTDEKEEERRLMYVAMTRAKDLLFLSYNKTRYKQGQAVPMHPSRFLSEIPEEYVKILGANPNT